MLAKKFKPAAIVMAAVMALGLTACASSATPGTATPAPTQASTGTTPADNSSTPAGTSGEDVTINIFQFKVEINDALKAATQAYMSNNPGVTINLETVGGGDDYGAALRAKFDSSTTIFNIGGPQDVQDWLSKLEDLSDQPWVSNAVDGTLSGVTVDGKVYGLPYAIEGYGLIYNTEIFEAAGVDAATLNSYAKIKEAFDTIDEQIQTGALADQYPVLEAVVEIPAKETWVTGLHALNTALNQEFSSDLEAFDSPTVEFTYADGLQKYFDLQADYSSNTYDRGKLNAVDYSTQVGGGIAIERVAVIQQGNWIYGDVSNVDPDVADKLAILPIPIEGTGKEDSIPIGVPMYWGINNEASDAEKTAAKDFLNWLYQSDEGKAIVVNEFYFIPPFKNYSGLEPQDALGKSVKAFADSGKTTSWVFMGFPTDWGMNVFGAKLQSYFDGSKSFDQVLSESAAEWAAAR